MKQQITKIALALAVITIWGTVFYRVYQAAAPSDDIKFSTRSFEPITKKNNTLDTFELFASYKDPFLGNHVKWSSPKPVQAVRVASRLSLVPKSIKQKVIPKKKAKKPVQFPAIVFKGYVANKGVKTLLITVDDRNQYLSQGQSVNGLSVVRAYEDSVWLRLEGELRTFKRE